LGRFWASRHRRGDVERSGGLFLFRFTIHPCHARRNGPGVVDSGYPKPISDWGWGDFGAHGIDAALYSDTKCYFFAGEHYIRVSRGDVDPGQIDSGYPAPISDWGWGDFGAHGIDAALNSGAFSYFFAGDRYIRVSRGDVGRGRIDEGYPAPISDWGWGPFGASGISAALFSGIDFDQPAPEPSSGLGSNSNYIFVSDCKPLIDLTVTIDLTQHVALLGNGPPSDGFPSVSGYGWQLNCYSPHHETDAWQQYVINVVDGDLIGQVNNWKNLHHDLVNQGQVLTGLSTVPAHWKLRIALRNDDHGNVTGVTFTVRGGEGQTVAESDMALTDIGVPAQDLSPIIAFELNLVGPGNAESAELFSGAGTITYTAKSKLTAIASEPPCARGWVHHRRDGQHRLRPSPTEPRDLVPAIVQGRAARFSGHPPGGPSASTPHHAQARSGAS